MGLFSINGLSSVRVFIVAVNDAEGAGHPFGNRFNEMRSLRGRRMGEIFNDATRSQRVEFRMLGIADTKDWMNAGLAPRVGETDSLAQAGCS
jgi:hypothetical protein